MTLPQAGIPERPEYRLSHRAVFAVTFLFVLVSVSVSTGLVIYTAWLHNLRDGLFALLFAVLSARLALSWCLWRHSCQQGRKPADEPMR